MSGSPPPDLKLLLPVTVALFARSPKLGEVKTRLAREIGAAAALAAHEELLSGAVHRLTRDPSYTVELWVAGSLDHPLLMHLAVVHGLELRLQQGGDLGSRMHAAMVAIRRDGAWPLIVGSDLPTLGPAHVQAGIAALNAGCDLVLAPTEDGGYGLIGMRDPDARAFDGVAWGTPEVLSQTLERARSARWRVSLLAQLWDVDDGGNYVRWRGLMEPGGHRER
jgi:uncharacterized protein